MHRHRSSARLAAPVAASFFAACLLAALPPAAFAQAYPTKPIRLIVPFAAGGGSDFVGRVIAQKLTDAMGQSVVVDNRSGAAALVGMEIAARAAPDGYTLLLADSALTINAAYYRQAKYDAVKDFDPISVICETPYVMVVNPALPYAGGIKEFIAAAKANPGKITIGSAGNGSGSHLAGELFRMRAGVAWIHVPYKSAGASSADVAAGQINATMTSVPAALPLVKAGRLKLIASAGEKRSALLPDVPTFAEIGIAGAVSTNWYSLVSVGGTPKPVLARLLAETHKAIAAPDVRERLTTAALEPAPNQPDQFRKMIVAELERWRNVLKDAGIKQE